VRAALIQFHAEYYSANQMKLVVIGKESLDLLQAIVQETFSDVPTNSKAAPRFDSEERHDIVISNKLISLFFRQALST
jgi:insulysin